MKYEKITHIDLFSGIGGFALAADRVWSQGGVQHIFCDNEPFAQEVLKKHWPDAPIYGDIRSLTYADHYGLYGAEDSKSSGSRADYHKKRTHELRQFERGDSIRSPFILTGGFPCQPFSQAGRRRGEEDGRFLWPEMLRVIREFSPLWVIAENVRGLLTQGGGLVFERVCTDLETAGYEVQPLIIPAVAVGAPHRRDRVWFIAHRNDERPQRSTRASNKDKSLRLTSNNRNDETASGGSSGKDFISSRNKYTPDPTSVNEERWDSRQRETQLGRSDWPENWLEVATRLCRVDDGLPKRLDRNPRLKALGNAIVPQVAEEIMRAILFVHNPPQVITRC